MPGRPGRADALGDSVLVGAVDDRTAQGLEHQVEAHHRVGRVGVDPEGVLADRVHDEEVAVRLVARRGSGPHEPGLATVVAQHERRARQRGAQRTLSVNGYQVVDVPGQGCCGALHAHAGLHAQAVELARANVAAFRRAPEATIVVNSAGCGAMLKEYPRLLGDDTAVGETIASWAGRVVDVTEALARAGPRRGASLPLRVAYDPPCHLLHAQRVADAPLKVLDAIPGLVRVVHEEADLCCGSAGSYSLTEPALSRAVLSRKVGALSNGRLDAVATGNPGCVMQIGAGLRAAGRDIPVLHPVELLDRSYALAGYYQS